MLVFGLFIKIKEVEILERGAHTYIIYSEHVETKELWNYFRWLGIIIIIIIIIFIIIIIKSIYFLLSQTLNVLILQLLHRKIVFYFIVLYRTVYRCMCINKGYLL